MENKEQPTTEKLSPMLQQYIQIKNNYKDYILFFRLGDFYEMFFDDAKVVSKELELTLTSRAGTAMCGVPHHASEVYIKKLIERGFKVAICEQTTDPAASKGLVEREVIRLVTAGTIIEASMLDEGTNNFVACVYADKSNCGLVFADISTGDVHVFEKKGKDIQKEIIGELSRYAPVELLFNQEFLEYKDVHSFVKTRFTKCVGELFEEEQFNSENTDVLTEQFQTETIDKLGLTAYQYATKALCAIFRYFKETQKATVKRFVKLNLHTDDEFMGLNLTTRRNLELTETMRNKERKGSLMWVLDKTSTSMGKRKLRQYIEQPLINPTTILRRLDSVDKLTKNTPTMYDICQDLRGIYDLERLMTRIVYKAATPRDVSALGKTCGKLPQLKADLALINAPLLNQLNLQISPLEDIANLVENAIVDEPPALVKDGNYIKDGFNDELDRLREITSGGKNILSEIEEREKEATGIRNLKVGYNRVFGYYIEVSKGQLELVPDRYIRKQTLSTGERYITDELKKIESEIIGANDKITALESDIFNEVREFITKQLETIQQTAEAIANVDVLCSFAIVSIENNYTKPDISLESVIEIKDGRHPVIEKMMNEELFTPNDTYLDISENKLIIITGPNMSGKSTFMRQVAIITLMAQIGCFVPAKYARIGVVDQIFTRVGASDDLAAGQSTFMVEMNEVAEILSNATAKSLVILDEIGRGTSTFDGISIAKAVAEYINGKQIGCKTLFATHYHELISLEGEQRGIRNFSVSAIKKGDDIRFLHKIVEGGVDDSYGIQVAKLAGIPNKVISRAKELLTSMERVSKTELEQSLKETENNESQIDFSAIGQKNAVNKLKSIDESKLTGGQALDLIAELKAMVK